jgi:hypothetical protein
MDDANIGEYSKILLDLLPGLLCFEHKKEDAHFIKL